MSREFDSKRSRSNYDRDPSPRRSRRDGRPATERNHARTRTEDVEIDEVRKQRRLQDPLPLQDQKSKVDVSTEDKGHERRSIRNSDGMKQSDPLSRSRNSEGMKQSDPLSRSRNSEGTKQSDPLSRSRNSEGIKQSDPLSRSRSSVQHDERGTQDGRAPWRRVTSEDRRQKDDTKDEKDRTTSTASKIIERGDKKPATRVEDNQKWRHDRFHETESDLIPSTKKRPPFREEKLPIEPETVPKLEGADMPEPNRSEIEGRRMEDKGSRYSRLSRSSNDHYHERDGIHVRDRRIADKGYRGNDGFPPRDRYYGGGGGRRFEDRERFGRRPDNRSVPGGGGNVEKWKHDLFDQVADATTNQKKEEDPVAKVEALLAL